MIIKPFTAPVYSRLINVDDSFVSKIMNKMISINNYGFSELYLVFLKHQQEESEEETEKQDKPDINLILNLIMQLTELKNNKSNANYGYVYLEKNIKILINNLLNNYNYKNSSEFAMVKKLNTLIETKESIKDNEYLKIVNEINIIKKQLAVSNVFMEKNKALNTVNNYMSYALKKSTVNNVLNKGTVINNNILQNVIDRNKLYINTIEKGRIEKSAYNTYVKTIFKNNKTLNEDYFYEEIINEAEYYRKSLIKDIKKLKVQNNLDVRLKELKNSNETLNNINTNYSYNSINGDSIKILHEMYIKQNNIIKIYLDEIKVQKAVISNFENKFIVNSAVRNLKNQLIQIKQSSENFKESFQFEKNYISNSIADSLNIINKNYNEEIINETKNYTKSFNKDVRVQNNLLKELSNSNNKTINYALQVNNTSVILKSFLKSSNLSSNIIKLKALEKYSHVYQNIVFRKDFKLNENNLYEEYVKNIEDYKSILVKDINKLILYKEYYEDTYKEIIKNISSTNIKKAVYNSQSSLLNNYINSYIKLNENNILNKIYLRQNSLFKVYFGELKLQNYILKNIDNLNVLNVNRQLKNINEFISYDKFKNLILESYSLNNKLSDISFKNINNKIQQIGNTFENINISEVKNSIIKNAVQIIKDSYVNLINSEELINKFNLSIENEILNINNLINLVRNTETVDIHNLTKNNLIKNNASAQLKNEFNLLLNEIQDVVNNEVFSELNTDNYFKKIITTTIKNNSQKIFNYIYEKFNKNILINIEKFQINQFENNLKEIAHITNEKYIEDFQTNEFENNLKKIFNVVTNENHTEFNNKIINENEQYTEKIFTKNFLNKDFSIKNHLFKNIVPLNIWTINKNSEIIEKLLKASFISDKVIRRKALENYKYIYSEIIFKKNTNLNEDYFYEEVINEVSQFKRNTVRKLNTLEKSILNTSSLNLVKNSNFHNEIILPENYFNLLEKINTVNKIYKKKNSLNKIFFEEFNVQRYIFSTVNKNSQLLLKSIINNLNTVLKREVNEQIISNEIYNSIKEKNVKSYNKELLKISKISELKNDAEIIENIISKSSFAKNITRTGNKLAEAHFNTNVNMTFKKNNEINEEIVSEEFLNVVHNYINSRNEKYRNKEFLGRDIFNEKILKTGNIVTNNILPVTILQKKLQEVYSLEVLNKIVLKKQTEKTHDYVIEEITERFNEKINSKSLNKTIIKTLIKESQKELLNNEEIKAGIVKTIFNKINNNEKNLVEIISEVINVQPIINKFSLNKNLTQGLNLVNNKTVLSKMVNTIYDKNIKNENLNKNIILKNYNVQESAEENLINADIKNVSDNSFYNSQPAINYRKANNTVETKEEVHEQHISSKEKYVTEEKIEKIISETVGIIIDRKLEENAKNELKDEQKTINDISKKVLRNIERELEYEKRRHGLI